MASIVRQASAEGTTRTCSEACHTAEFEECVCICNGRFHGMGEAEAQAALADILSKRTGQAWLGKRGLKLAPERKPNVSGQGLRQYDFKVGTTLVAHWKGKEYRVDVGDAGEGKVEYTLHAGTGKNGRLTKKPFSGLSAAAKHITGNAMTVNKFWLTEEAAAAKAVAAPAKAKGKSAKPAKGVKKAARKGKEAAIYCEDCGELFDSVAEATAHVNQMHPATAAEPTTEAEDEATAVAEAEAQPAPEDPAEAIA